MSTNNNISRRSFVKNISLASGGLILACNYSLFSNEMNTTNAVEFNPNLFVQLNTDGSLILIASRSEMGNGVRTSLTSVIADEMEADWNQVSVKQAVGDAKYGDQNTDGSRSILYLYETMRKMGAMTKAMLITAAAKTWQVPESECHAQNHFVIHTGGKKIGFGALAETAKTLEIPTNITYKNPKDFKYIGKSLKSIDVANYANGSAIFGIDKRLPNMKFAAIARCPVTFGTVQSFDKSAAMKIRGVLDVIEIPRIEKPFGPLGGIAVIATSTWAAFEGKKALAITWNYGKNETYDSEAYMVEITKNVHQPAKVEKEIGNVDQAFASANKIIESTFQLPHLAHAPMEVPNAVAWVQGDTCQVWAPTQDPQTAREEVTAYLATTSDKVTLNVTFLGGGFGRKSKPDYIVEAVILSKAIHAPVQVVWTREDDIKHGYYHTVSSQYMKASLDNQGRVTGWLHRFALPSIMSTFTPGIEFAQNWEIATASDIPYEIKNLKVEVGQAPAHVRIGWMRSVINIPHGFAVNVFADELAFAANKDPLEFRLDLIGSDRLEDTKDPIKYDTKRLKNVLKRAAKNANWHQPLPNGHAYGIAVQYSFYTYVASVVEVSMLNDKIKVHNIYTVIDCGTVINSDTVKAQLEGAAIFGMSLAFYGKITAKNGIIEQNSFSDYPLIRMNEIPKVHVDIVESTENPTGVGEPGVPVIAPAIVNAIFKLTGKRYYNLPLSDYNLV
ncbi:xanthine dehydrogenase family protein molybdopterin-binding subunit [Flavobacterium restrictum]|uniref:Xanthine dehydrogenase family protein molybdopterin-binding subunit n=1 Tax=Flavobacterium restrictum TaxID=2594428 RepID=A0A553E2S9_9FLAO|nr:molybdopterin cofactor-binding domain-containing protein [Flavobacterium restrictum]TRX39285.1 xanthine dehydrogenase family protein molybdopterin-binding subunit [Flavobacterium restrictum]